MKWCLALSLFPTIMLSAWPSAAASLPVDRIPTSRGDLEITFIGHGSLMLSFNGKTIHVDPYGKLADYSQLPDADLILITHEHQDHLDAEAIAAISGESTTVVANPAAGAEIPGAVILENGQKGVFLGLPIEAVPAYNRVHKRDSGEPFHPRGRDNGYVVTFGDLRVYIAGDTEDIEEMKDLGKIDVAFIPVNLPYTMTLEMAANAARMIKPGILYPYHYGETDIEKVSGLLGDMPEIEVRIRPMK